MLLEVLVDAAHGLHTGVIGARHGRLVPLAASLLLVPVVDTAHEGRNQLHARIAAGHGLAEGKQQGQVGADALGFQLLRRLDAFPGRGNLDQHTVVADALLVVQRHDAFGSRHGRSGVKGQTRIHLGGHAARHQLENRAAKLHQQFVHGARQILRTYTLHRLGEQRRVVGFLHRLQDERGVGGGILRLELHHLVEVTGVRDHRCGLFEGIKLVHVGHYAGFPHPAKPRSPAKTVRM